VASLSRTTEWRHRTRGAILPGIDNRSTWARRCRDQLAAHISDLGGQGNISAGEMALAKRAAVLVAELERREAEFAKAGSASDEQLITYVTAANSLKRLCECLGLRRRSKTVGSSLGDILMPNRQPSPSLSDLMRSPADG
jgi:hypothetical protein